MGEIGGDRVGGLLTHVIKRSGKKFTRTVVVGEETFVSSLEIRSDPYLSPNAGWWQSYLRGSPPVTVVRSGRPLRVVDAFCGSGGLSLGVRLAAAALGCTVDFVAAIDTDPSAMAVYTANLAPGVALTASAPTLVDFHVFGQGEKVEFGYRPELMNAPLSAVAPVDLFIAGPPCEGHSNLNNHTRREDPRNHLYLTAIALGVSLGARAILIENVPEFEERPPSRGPAGGGAALFRRIRGRDRGFQGGRTWRSATPEAFLSPRDQAAVRVPRCAPTGTQHPLRACNTDLLGDRRPARPRCGGADGFHPGYRCD